MTPMEDLPQLVQALGVINSKLDDMGFRSAGSIRLVPLALDSGVREIDRMQSHCQSRVASYGVRPNMRQVLAFQCLENACSTRGSWIGERSDPGQVSNSSLASFAPIRDQFRGTGEEICQTGWVVALKP